MNPVFSEVKGLDEILALPSVCISERRKLPKSPSIYFLVVNGRVIAYIGMALNLKQRWTNHEKYGVMRGCIFKADSREGITLSAAIHYIMIESNFIDPVFVELMQKCELALIQRFSPVFNCDGTTGRLGTFYDELMSRLRAL